jgi:hypothetical protein
VALGGLFFMCGGVSHIDTFDPKDNRWAGTLIGATIVALPLTSNDWRLH